MAEAAPDEKSESKSSSPSRMGAILSYVFIGLNLVVMAIGSYLVYANSIGYHFKSITEEDEHTKITKERVFRDDEPILYTMESFTINLAGFPRRVIRMTINLEMLDEEGFEEIITLGARARDTVVKLLNAKTYQDIESIQGKLMLKDEIALELNHSLHKGVIRDIYFSDFVVQ